MKYITVSLVPIPNGFTHREYALGYGIETGAETRGTECYAGGCKYSTLS